MKWYNASNSNATQPAEVESTKKTVFVRKDFTLVAESTDSTGATTPSHYEYLECKMSKEAYELYKQNVALTDYLDMIS